MVKFIRRNQDVMDEPYRRVRPSHPIPSHPWPAARSQSRAWGAEGPATLNGSRSCGASGIFSGRGVNPSASTQAKEHAQRRAKVRTP